MIKRTDAADSWWIADNKRTPSNVAAGPTILGADLNSAELSPSAYHSWFMANGFKILTPNTSFNASGGTYVYMAFAEAPFVNSNGVPCNAR